MLWIGTLSNGINIYNPEEDNFFRLKNESSDPTSISSDYIRELFEDKSHVLWIGTIGGGLNKIDRKPGKFFYLTNDPDNLNSLSKNFIYSICEDSYGEIWFGTYQKELDRYNPAQNKFIHYSSNPLDPKSLNGEIVRSIYEDSDKDLWIGTYFGSLQKFDRKNDSFIRIDLSDLIRENPGVVNIRTIYEDREKVLWFGTNGGGLIKYEKGRNGFKRYSTESMSGLSNDHILSICEDSEGYLWVGTYGGGLNKFDKTKEMFSHYKHSLEDSSSLSDNVITKLYCDSRGVLWVGTYFGGLNKFNKGTNSFTHYTDEEGLPSNLICDIIEDNKGIFWISTIRGITKFNPSTGSISNYDQSSGTLEEYNPGAGFKTKGGLVYFGSIDGVTYFHPDSIRENNHIPNIVITSFKKLNKQIDFNKNIAYIDTITLSYKEIYFSVEFASLDYTEPEKNQFAYMLEGFDKDWVYAGNRNIANYTNIDPGEYIFKVKGSNNDGVWNENGASVMIVITPPFWETWWFDTVFIIAFLSIGPIIYYRRVSSLKREKKQNEEFAEKLIHSQEEERKRIASELHDSLGQDLLIIKNLALLALQKNEKEFTVKQLQEISSTSSSTIEEVRQIAYNLHPYQLDRLGLTKAIKSIILQIVSLTKIKFEDNIENIDDLFSKEQEINVYRIIQECINNIIKHSNASEAELQIIKDEELIIKVSDNGKGFNIRKAELNSKGFGIKNLYKRVNILNGEINVTSTLGNGTKIWIKVPVEK